MARKLPLPHYIIAHVEQLRLTTREKLVVALTGAFGVVIGLSWNDTVKALIERVLTGIGFPNNGSLLSRFTSSVFATMIGVTVIVILSLWAKNEDQKKKDVSPDVPSKETLLLPAAAPPPKPKA